MFCTQLGHSWCSRTEIPLLILGSVEHRSFLLLSIKRYRTRSFHMDRKEFKCGKTGFMLIQFCCLLLSYPLLCLGGGVMFELPETLWSQGQNGLSLKATEGEKQLKCTYLFPHDLKEGRKPHGLKGILELLENMCVCVCVCVCLT